MSTSVGLQIDAHAIKAVVLVGNEKSAKVKSFVIEKLDGSQGPDGDIVSILQRFFTDHKIPTANVNVSIRALDCVLRDCSVPFIKEAQIEQTIKFQAESFFHSVSIDDLIIQYSKYAEIDTSSRLLVAGIKKGHVERRLGLLEEVGVDPVAVDLDVAALTNTYHSAGVTRNHKLVVIVDIEANNLRIVIIENGQLRTARSIRKRFGERAQKAREESGGSSRLPVVILDEGDDEDSFSLEDSNITSMERESYLSGVFREVDKTVALCNSDEAIDFMCLTGASCTLPGIEDMFEDYFEVEVRKVDLTKIYQVGKGKLADLSMLGAVPLGLALKGLGVDSTGMDFRQEEFLFQGRFEKLKKGLACSLCLVFMMCFLYAFGLKQELRVKKERLKGVKILQEHIYTVLFPVFDDPLGEQMVHHKEPLVRNNWSLALKKEYERLANLFGGSLTKKAVNESAIDILREFGRLKALGPKDVQVTSARISQDQSRIHCVSPRRESRIYLIRKLNISKMFVAEAQRVTNKGGNVEFDVVLKLIVKKETQ
jgi:Tfp pilus assembly PilM family ATPase